MKLLFKGHFDVISGYGACAVEMCVNFERVGIDVYPVAMDIDFELPREFTDLFTKKEPKYMDAAIVFALPNELTIDDNWKKRVKKRIAYTMWEQTRLSEDLWRYYKSYENYNELWVPCEMNKIPFSEITDIPIKVMSLGVDTKFYKFENRDWKNGPLKYCMNGALGYRKGVFEVLEAYRMLTEKHPKWNVELHLKTSQGFVKDFAKIAPNIFINMEIFDLNQMRKFYNSMHVMLAPSRGEGFHRPPLEFMSTGGLVITTNWGGSEIWFKEGCCLEVKHTLEQTLGKWGGALENSFWANPDTFEILRKMEFVYMEREEAKKIAEEGSKRAREFDWSIIILKMKERLQCLLNTNSR